MFQSWALSAAWGTPAMLYPKAAGGCISRLGYWMLFLVCCGPHWFCVFLPAVFFPYLPIAFTHAHTSWVLWVHFALRLPFTAVALFAHPSVYFIRRANFWETLQPRLWLLSSAMQSACSLVSLSCNVWKLRKVSNIIRQCRTIWDILGHIFSVFNLLDIGMYWYVFVASVWQICIVHCPDV